MLKSKIHFTNGTIVTVKADEYEYTGHNDSIIQFYNVNVDGERIFPNALEVVVEHVLFIEIE
jgi:hypothetical protein